MSRYRPVNGLSRCAICRKLTHRRCWHSPWAYLQWYWENVYLLAWDKGHRLPVILIGVGVLVLSSLLLAIARISIGE